MENNNFIWYQSPGCIGASPVYVSDKMTGKMQGVYAISTSAAVNPICAARAKDKNSVCAKCYAFATINRFASLADHLEENTAVLTGSVLPDYMLPQFSRAVAMVRIEAFGDIQNTIQVVNYFNICKRSPWVNFALWTKNAHIIAAAIEAGAKKPANLIIVYSSPILNKRAAGIFEKYPFIDKVFTVYDDETIARENIVINCGGKRCAACGSCYFDKDIKEISERLK